MRILQFSDVDGLHPEGTYLRVTGLAQALQKNSHSVTMTFRRGAKNVSGRFVKRNTRLIDSFIRIEQFSRYSDATRILTERIESPILRIYMDFAAEYDIIHSHNHTQTSLALRLRRENKPKILFDVHGLLLPMSVTGQISAPSSNHHNRIIKWQQSLFRQADGVSFVSELLRKRMICRFGIDESKTYVIPDGVDFTHISGDWNTRDVMELRSSWDAVASVVLMYAGILTTQHGAPYLLAVLREALANDFLSSHIRVVIIGDGPYEKGFKELRRQYPNHVFLVKSVRYCHLPTYLAAADVHLVPHPKSFLMDSIMSNKLLNCLASGKATIATHLSFPSTFLEDGKNVLFCDPENPRTMVSAIETVVRDSNWANKIGKEGSVLVKSQFDWSIVVASAERTYKDLASNAL